MDNRKIEYNIIDLRDNSSIMLVASTSLSRIIRAYAPGHWGLQAIATFSNGRVVKSDCQTITIQNPLYSEIMTDPSVVAKMESLWEAAVREAEGYSYKEKGCKILFNTTNNTYEFEDVPDSEEFECQDMIEINFEYSTTIGYPDRGGTYFVGTFHTHPARTPCDNTAKYWVGPSPVDNNMNTVCLLYEYTGSAGWIKGGHEPRSPHKLYHYGTYKNTPCGKERHPLPQ